MWSRFLSQSINCAIAEGQRVGPVLMSSWISLFCYLPFHCWKWKAQFWTEHKLINMWGLVGENKTNLFWAPNQEVYCSLTPLFTVTMYSNYCHGNTFSWTSQDLPGLQHNFWYLLIVMLLITVFPPIVARKLLLPYVPSARNKLILNQLWGEVTLRISCWLFSVFLEILSSAASSASTHWAEMSLLSHL